MIRAEGLTMHYGQVKALQDVSFEVKKGEIVGLLGPNGAGKSTCMKIFTTYLHPTHGTATVGGFDVIKEPLKVRKCIGYLPEVLPLYMDMEVRSYLNFVGKARGLNGSLLEERTKVVLEQCGLHVMYRRPIRELSKGYRQRTALAQALIHDPDIIILDEPTSGLDPHQIVDIRRLIKELVLGRTVIISTHILQEVEAIADRIVIINQGKIVGDGTIDELRERAQAVERTKVAIVGTAAELKPVLSALPGITKIELIDEKNQCASFLLFSKPGTKLWREIGKTALVQRWELQELSDRPLTLEETFMALTEKVKRTTCAVTKGGAE